MAPYLNPEWLIESDHPDLVSQARDIASHSNNPVTVARRLVQWVYRNLEKKPVVSVPDALEVFKARVGDCNEHAVLLTALLRASGIPARICVGLVYSRGQFFYHAWVECFLNDWVSVDPTLNQIPADATHIKLVEGGIEKQAQIIALMGKLEMELVNYEYDSIGRFNKRIQRVQSR